MIRATVVGCCGRMGQMIIREVLRQPDMRLVGAMTHSRHPKVGTDIGELVGVGPIQIEVSCDLSAIISQTDVVIEFTTPTGTLDSLRVTALAGKAMVIGTTGLSDEALAEVRELAARIPCVMAPNMSVGVNVMLQHSNRFQKRSVTIMTLRLSRHITI